MRVRRNGNEKLLLLTGADNTPVTTMRQADEAASLVRMAIESKTLTELETFVKLVKFKLSA